MREVAKINGLMAVCATRNAGVKLQPNETKQ